MFIVPPAVQADPSYSSVAPTTGLPPKPTAAVCNPAPAKPNLAVPKFPPAVQVDQSYSSVAFETAVMKPPKANPAV